MVAIQHERTTHRGANFDDDIVEFWVDLPSGARLYFSDIVPGPYDRSADVEVMIRERTAALQAAIAELRHIVLHVPGRIR